MAMEEKRAVEETAPRLSRWVRFWRLMKRLGPVGPVAVISMTLPAVAGAALLIVAASYQNGIQTFVDAHLAAAVVIYIVGFALLAGFPVLPTYSVSLVGGFVFKFQLGVAASLAGYIGAAMVSYLFLRLLSGERVEQVIDERPKWKAVRRALLARSFWKTLGLVALLRIPPNIPFAVVNLVIVTARIRLGVYLAGTIAGVIPRTLAVVYIASEASQFKKIETNWPLSLAGIGVTVLVLGVISYMAHRAIRGIAAENKAGDTAR
jgi:uncharacterized membrane protein YdjX (TVP38/TMEM64 family)